MRKTKRLATMVLAVVMAFMLAVPVFANPVDTPGNVEVPGAGSVVYIDTTVYRVLLPTTAAMNFTMDPQGLLGDTLPAPGTLPTDGLIRNTGVLPMVVNQSSVPIDMTVTAVAATTNGTVPTQATATFITAGADIGAVRTAVNAGTTNNVLLYIVPSSNNLTAVTATSNDYTPSTSAFGIGAGAASAELNFRLAATAYQFTAPTTPGGPFGFSIVNENAGNGTMFNIGGLVNVNADWTDFAAETNPSTVSFTATFAWDSAGELIPLDATAVTGVANLVVGGTGADPAPVVNTWSVAIDAPLTAAITPAPIRQTGFGTAGSLTATRAPVSATVGTPYVVPFVSGEYTIASVRLGNPDSALSAAAWSVSSTAVTITPPVAFTDRTIVITLSNDDVYTFDFEATT